LQSIDSTILFGDITSLLDQWLQSHNYSSIHVLCDENTFHYCWPILNAFKWPSEPSVVVIPAGETAKNLRTCEIVWDALVENSADRNSLLINLGGGVITDLGGFCAASFMRGIKFLHIPTTVLGMTDAAIGGKHGVDFRMYKNYIGTFAEPECICIDNVFLNTLDDDEVRSGLAEVAKHGFLADKGLIEILLQSATLNNLDWNALLRRSIQVKLKFVHDDIYDRGLRTALNFGHTIGHAIETKQLQADTPLRHGEAVALGMMVEAAISVRLLDLPHDQMEIIEETVRKLFPELAFPEIPFEELQKLIFKDKKKSGKDVLYALLKAIEQPVVGQIVPTSILNEAYLHYNK
jgi:3-dehydroquinate synthase